MYLYLYFLQTQLDEKCNEMMENYFVTKSLCAAGCIVCIYGTQEFITY